MRFLAFISLFGLMAFPSPAGANDKAVPNLRPQSTIVSPPKLNTAELDRRAQLLMGQLEMTGMAMAIVENGEITFAKGYGEKLRDSGMMVNADTVFRWASVSKSVGAHSLLALAEDGSVGLNDPINTYSTSLNLPKSEQPLRLGHLLSHQVGLVRNAFDSRIEAGRSARHTRARLSELKYLCPPGTCHTYQNVVYDAMSEVIESRTGLPYKTVVQSQIFDRLGMSTASMTLDGLVKSKNWARPHGRYGQRKKSVKPTYYRIPAAAGVNSSVKDLAKWMIAQMPGETHIPEERLAAMQTPIVPTWREQKFLNRRFGDLKSAHYGMGWRVYDYHGNKVIGHRGGVDGYRALVMFDPEKKAGIAVLWNSPHTRPIGLQMEFLDQLYGLPRRDWLRLKETEKAVLRSAAQAVRQGSSE